MLFCIDTDAGVGYKVQPCSLIILDHGKAEFGGESSRLNMGISRAKSIELSTLPAAML